MKRIINIRPLSEETMRKSFGSSMEDKLRELKDEIKELFKQKFKCDENKLNNLQIIQKIDFIIKECNE